MMKKLQQGQTIIEILVALSVAIILISTAVTVVLTALKSSQNSKTRNQAYRYAQEALETVRQIRDTNYITFSQQEGTYCLPKDAQELSAACSETTPNVDSFIRTVVVTQTSDCGPGVASVSATVSWSDSDCVDGGYCHTVNAVTCLLNITPLPTP